MKSSYLLVVIILKKNNFREKLIQYLKKNRIETRPTFSPIHKMPTVSPKYFLFEKFKNMKYFFSKMLKVQYEF